VWTALALSLALVPFALAQFPPAPGTGPGLPETIEAIDSARVTTRILYITAHPDDESAAVLTYLARGLHAQVALLTLTRGEGGQNALGPEQAPQLGLIRTQELLAATRGYGVKLYFTRARDFGYSKTPEETEKVWGGQVLEDIVRVIRDFRPNIVINGWGGVHSGHGHHQASGLLTPRAVQLAADNSYRLYSGCADCPEDYAWGSASDPVTILDVERGSDASSGYVLPLDDVSPLWGKTWREIGLDAFVNHRTQGISAFINSPFLRRPIALKREDGQKFDHDILSRSLDELATIPTANGCSSPDNLPAVLKKVGDAFGEARAESLSLNWREASTSLARAGMAFRSLHPEGKKPPMCSPSNPFLFLDAIEDAQERIDRAVQLAAGLDFEGNADRSALANGETFEVTTTARCRGDVNCELAPANLILPSGMKETARKKDASGRQVISVEIVSETQKIPGWDTGLPEGLPLVSVEQQATVAGYKLNLQAPVTHVEATSTTVFRVPLRMVPAYTLSVDPREVVEVLDAENKPFQVLLRVHSYSTKPAKVSVGLEVPDGLRASPPVEVEFAGAGDQYAKLTVTPPKKLEAGNFTITAYAKRGEEKFTTTLEPLPSMPTLLWSEPSQTVVHAFDIHVPGNLRVGYISAEGEPIPDALQRLGIRVELLDTTALAFGDLSKYDAIVVGVRAYELRSELAGANKRLLDYVANGGTLVVQYNRDYIWDKLQPAPYPAKIGNPTPRITDENSPVKFLKPDDPLLNRPNKITLDDFQGWVQERGLYFWSDFDSRYTPLLAMNDPGEKDLNGGLVYAKYGKGTYIYTGLSFFRELPDGVPGAYRLFVNLLSASRTN
jgi:LmbE family N-acetylglucosaminyl deacetylase